MVPEADTEEDMLHELAPAKINLFLHITGRQSSESGRDGYHLIESLFVFAKAADRLGARLSDDLSLLITGPNGDKLPVTDDNLVLGAARALQKLVGRRKPVSGARIVLEKHLPVAAGIGGGSADAAATLRLLTRLWGLDLPAERLAALALDLGADVPACLDFTPKLVLGIGEIIKPLPSLPTLAMLLVNPGFGLSTADVFTEYTLENRDFGAPVYWPDDALAEDGLVSFLEKQRNDLQSTACHIAPEIENLIREIERQPGCRLARMSGSGATCFGLFRSRKRAEDAASVLRSGYPKAWVWAGSTLA